MTVEANQQKQMRAYYQDTFNGKAGERVLSDLRQFTKYGSSPFTADAQTLAYNVGMQDVFRHIATRMNLSDAAIYKLLNQQEESFVDVN